MKVPIIDRDKQWDDLFEPLSQYLRVCDDGGNFVGNRKDVDYAKIFMVFDTKGDTLIHPEQISVAEKFIVPYTPTVHDAVHLFWNIYQPQLMAIPSVEDVQDFSAERLHRQMNPPAPSPSAELNRLLLDCLDWVYDRFQVPYEPDSDNAEKLLELVIELHIAAARAFKLKQVEGNQISEEWMSRLQAVEIIVRQVRAIVGTRTFRNPSFAISIDAIWGMTQLELSRVSRAGGSYADAVHYLDQASTSYIWALDEIEYDSSDAGPMDRYGDNLWTRSLDWDEEHFKNQESLTRKDLRNRLTPLQVSLEETASLFSLLKQSASSDVKWRQITDDCLGLSILPYLEWEVFTGVEDEEIVEDEGQEMALSWSEFWHSARAYASARMSPTDLEEYYRKTRETEAETRLKNYFFSSDWQPLPERARRRLINADILLNSTQRVGQEGLLNELRIATEELCHLVVWQPLSNSKTPPLEFIREKLKLDERPERSDPNIFNYIRICRARWYRDFLVQQSFDRNDVKFLTKQLPRDMSQLRSERNPAEHKIGASAALDSPQSFYRGFLGIGRPGVLPQLARIGRKLQSHRR